MLVASPLRLENGTPRVISEIRKRNLISPTPNYRPKLTGDLLVKCGGENTWHARRVSIRGGQLHLSPSYDDRHPSVRLPLRHLSLQAGSLINSLALCRGGVILLTIQAPNQHTFDLWAKTIAIEIIRQTPLDDVKYLDILTFIDVWQLKKVNSSFYVPHETKIETDENSNFVTCDNKNQNVINTNDETKVEKLLKKCQNVESYVPVKEKLVLFETLCKLDRKVRSSEDVSCREKIEAKRTRSMYDLTHLNSHIAVREICKYFENKGDSKTFPKMDNKRLIVLSNSVK